MIRRIAGVGLRWVGLLTGLLIAASAPVLAATHVGIAKIPVEVRADDFIVTIDGHTTPVVHAASSYYLVNFDIDGPAMVSVRASDPHYWDRGVEIQPMRYGIRPVRRGATITFPIPGPVKLSITRPGDHFADAEMLFLLGSEPDRSGITAKTKGVRYWGPGVYREDITAASGDHIYLAAGAVVFGSLNLWQVHDVHVEGRGIILYDGPQNPLNDQGWMHQENWHAIVMDHATNIEIDGITAIVRSRTWQVQMRSSRGIGFYNVNIIGGEAHDANQDGMDWLGGGDTTVRDCFIRASDDDFAIQGNWDGYTDEAMRIPGEDVTNITIEDSVVSTSISNTLRVGWPKKTFRSAHVRMSNIDVIHSGFGACVIPFGFLEMWSDDGGVESHTDYRFNDIRLEDFYSLAQIRMATPEASGIVFSNITAMDGPGMAPTVLQGHVSGVALNGVRLAGKVATSDADIPVDVENGAAQPVFGPARTDASWNYSPGLIRPREQVTFRVASPDPGWRYQWLFGDGTSAVGSVVEHAFPDEQGTLLDGSGRFRVVLHATRVPNDEVWVSRALVVARKALAAEGAPPAGGLGLGLSSTTEHATEYSGWVQIPADGGYSFTLVTSRRATVTLDGLSPAQSPELRIEVCGSLGDAVQPVRVSAALVAGWHRIRIDLDAGIENEPQSNLGDGGPLLLWEGPGILPQAVPAGALAH